MDFYTIRQRTIKRDFVEIYPDFIVGDSKDLMIRGKDFYAIWDEEAGLWSTKEYDVQRIVDKDLRKYFDEHIDSIPGNVSVKYMSSYSSNSWKDFKKFVKDSVDNYHELDKKICYNNETPSKKDYISRKLPYDLRRGNYSNYSKLISTLYSPEERAKIEWAIGAIITGDSKAIQKFLVLYGEPGTGKSTVLEIIQRLFEGYYTSFEAKALTSSSNVFSTETFKSNPLIAIQHDGDLSRIEDNSKLNSIISHEEIIINEKYKSSYPMRVNCFLFMATNKPVKITDAKAGLIRRLIDVRPTGDKLSPDEYIDAINGIEYELGAIAYHCREVYNKMGKNYYNKYRPVDMMYKTDPFFNFVEYFYNEILINQETADTTLKMAYDNYKEYCQLTHADHILQMYKFREELKDYYKHFSERYTLKDGTPVRSYYSGFLVGKFNAKMEKTEPGPKLPKIIFKDQESVFDYDCTECSAQLATKDEIPGKKWDYVTTKLKDIDTRQLHYVKVPENHIVIDFDIKDEEGKKSFELNLEAASKFPETYAELSKSGAGIHLHYIYDGDVNQLSRIYDDDIEVKVFTGNSSLRRKLTLCNDLPINTINSGLPLKAKKGDKMLNAEGVKSEKGLRALIKKCLNKEIHDSTKPNVDFIAKILNDAYESGLHYDISDMKQAIIAFAANSTNQADTCLKIVAKMRFKSEDVSENGEDDSNKPIIFYDVEVFPNLFLINWKKEGPENPVIRMINPTPAEVEALLQFRLVGFNCRRYDNHILYARIMGYTNAELFRLSQRIVNSSSNDALFGEAYNLSYTDIYDYASTKQSLKKWEIELGIHHMELGLPWDQPVAEELWNKVAEYCDNDVISTEAVWNATKQDFVARQMLATLSGLTVNDTTRLHTTRIIFGTEKHPELVYTDLSKEFPGYEFVKFGDDGKKHNMYRGTDLGFGGYVYAEPGMYYDVALLDVNSLHPNSIRAMNCFGDYTKKFTDILDARLAIKHKDFATAGSLMNGAFKPFLKDEKQAKELAQALKIIINSVYGYTSATFDNPFKDPRNENNIVALRGALFMRTLQDEVVKRGFTVAHIKTDSIKIPNATPEIINFCMEFAKRYGYVFEHEATYERMCLVNDAVYIAKYKDGEDAGKWTATGTQFQIPYVFKKLFSKEPIEFNDLCETKSVTTSLYLDMNENLGEDEHDYQFIGKVGSFCPIKPGCGGGILLREKNGKYSSATGAKGYRWLEAETVKNNHMESAIDHEYYISLVNEAIATINEYGDFERFASDDPYSN